MPGVAHLEALHPIIGTFDDLPEGSEVVAEYEKKPYRWQLT